jgi:hypothetical protein
MNIKEVKILILGRLFVQQRVFFCNCGCLSEKAFLIHFDFSIKNRIIICAEIFEVYHQLLYTKNYSFSLLEDDENEKEKKF